MPLAADDHREVIVQSQGRSARLQAKRAPAGDGNVPAGPAQAVQAAHAADVVMHPPPQQNGQAGDAVEPTVNIPDMVPCASSASPVQPPDAALPVAAPPPTEQPALPAASQQGQEPTVLPEQQQQQQQEPQPAVESAPAMSSATAQPPADPGQNPVKLENAVQQPAQPQLVSHQAASAELQTPDATPAPPAEGQPLPAQAAAAAPSAAASKPAAAAATTATAAPLQQQLSQLLPPAPQQPQQAPAVGLVPAAVPGMVPVVLPPCCKAPPPAAAAPAPAPAPAAAVAQPVKRKRRKYRRRRFSDGGSDLDDDDLFDEDDLLPVAAPPPLPPPETDDLFGCSKCRYAKNGCTVCRERPIFSRPKQRWKPQQGRPQDVRLTPQQKMQAVPALVWNQLCQTRPPFVLSTNILGNCHAGDSASAGVPPYRGGVQRPTGLH